MRIAVFARHPGGGIRTYFSYVYGNSVFSEDTFQIICPKEYSLSEEFDRSINIRQVVESESGNFSLLWRLAWFVLRCRPDIVHSHGFTAGLLAAFPLWLLRIPHIVTTHDVFLPGQFAGLKGRIKHLIIGRVLGLATVINPVGKDAEENFIHTFPHLKRRNKVQAIRNGIPAESFSGDTVRDLRSEAEISANALVLGFFGRFMAQKGFRTLVDAVDRWNENAGDEQQHLHVCCFGWGGFIREEQADLKKRNLDQYFHFFPATNDMGPAIRGTDAVVMPSRWEACPLLAMEVLVAGAPLLATNCIGLKEVVADTPTMVFDVGSVEGLANHLNEFARNQQIIRKGFEVFRKEAVSRFDVESTAQSLSRLFTSVNPGK